MLNFLTNHPFLFRLGFYGFPIFFFILGMVVVKVKKPLNFREMFYLMEMSREHVNTYYSDPWRGIRTNEISKKLGEDFGAHPYPIHFVDEYGEPRKITYAQVESRNGKTSLGLYSCEVADYDKKGRHR